LRDGCLYARARDYAGIGGVRTILSEHQSKALDKAILSSLLRHGREKTIVVSSIKPCILRELPISLGLGSARFPAMLSYS